MDLAALDLLAGSDIKFRRETRLDIALAKNHPIALVFLPAADIPTFVGEGRVDLGITGLDQIEEHKAIAIPTDDSGVEEVLDLQFGSCKLQVQVPERGAIDDPKGLIGKNVCTSYVGLTERYFANLEGVDSGTSHSSVPMHDKLQTKIKYVGGSVEAACALGVADGVVDLVGKDFSTKQFAEAHADTSIESGETMRAAGLKAIDTLVESKAVLIKSKHPSNIGLVNIIASRMRGLIAAQQFVLCQYNIPRSLLGMAKEITPGKRAPTITQIDEADWVAISSMVEKKKIASVMDELASCGATDILVLEISNSR
ncbi:MAG: hypothetical protein Q9190_004211 [Brigantiaea leucoxantha]